MNFKNEVDREEEARMFGEGSDALQSKNLSNFQGRLLQSQIVASKGL